MSAAYPTPEQLNPWKPIAATTEDNGVRTETTQQPIGDGANALIRVSSRTTTGNPAVAEASLFLPTMLSNNPNCAWRLAHEADGARTYFMSVGAGVVVRVSTRLETNGAVALAESLSFAPAVQVRSGAGGRERLAR